MSTDSSNSGLLDFGRSFWRSAPRVAHRLLPLSFETIDDTTFRLLTDNMPTLCWVANSDGYIVWYNRRWHEYCGTTPQQMEGWGWQSTHDPAVLASVMERWTASISSGAPFEMTFPLLGADGIFRPFLTRVQPMHDATGQLVRWFGVNTEISDQAAAEAALRIERDRSSGVLEGMGEGFVLLDREAHLDERYVAGHLGVSAGQYVLIAITDTGTGMPEAVIAKAFDPFFTTKEIGKGTGLGLSQVYGFVKQSGGHVKIYSQSGVGTTVKVYMPRLVGDDTSAEQSPLGRQLPLGEFQEVVLAVEDEPAVRRFSVDALTELGYRVVEAGGAVEALRLLDTHPEIALIFTDIVMPDMNGAKLAEEARRRRANVKVLFTTGYTRNAVVHNGVLDAGVHLIGKPFTIEELAAKVREVLDSRRSSQND